MHLISDVQTIWTHSGWSFQFQFRSGEYQFRGIAGDNMCVYIFDVNGDFGKIKNLLSIKSINDGYMSLLYV